MSERRGSRGKRIAEPRRCAAAAIAAAVGPLLGGFITTYLSWRVAFLLEDVVIVIVLMLIGRNQAGAAQILGSLPIAIILLLFIIASAWHMKIGMQVVIEDYVHGEGTRIALPIANTFFAIAVFAVSAIAILKLALGG